MYMVAPMFINLVYIGYFAIYFYVIFDIFTICPLI